MLWVSILVAKMTKVPFCQIFAQMIKTIIPLHLGLLVVMLRPCVADTSGVYSHLLSHSSDRICALSFPIQYKTVLLIYHKYHLSGFMRKPVFRVLVDILNRLRLNDHAMICWICNVRAKDKASSDSLLTKLGIQD